MRTPQIIGILRTFVLALLITSASAAYAASLKTTLTAEKNPTPVTKEVAFNPLM